MTEVVSCVNGSVCFGKIATRDKSRAIEQMVMTWLLRIAQDRSSTCGLEPLGTVETLYMSSSICHKLCWICFFTLTDDFFHVYESHFSRRIRCHTGNSTVCLAVF